MIDKQFTRLLWKMPRHWFSDVNAGVRVMNPISYALYQAFCLTYNYEFGKFDLAPERLVKQKNLKGEDVDWELGWGQHKDDWKILLPIYNREKERYKIMKPIESYHKWNGDALAMIANMKTTPQSAIHHAEGDVYIHTQMVTSEVEKVISQFSERSQKLLLYTALLHDIAKPMTTVWEEEDWRSPGHAKLGEAISREILWKDFSMEDREEVAALIRFHGLPIWFQEKQDTDMAIIGASLRCNLNELATFAQCDFRGRVCNDLEETLFKIELFKEKAQELGCLNEPYKFTSDWARLHYFKNGEYPGKEIWEPEGAWCVVMCGMPGSGKNTWVEKNWSGHIVEMDSIRKKHKISPRDKDAQGFVAQEAKEELRVALRKKEDVLWNATNLTVQQRSIIIDLALQYKAKIKIVYVDCSKDEALARNKGREEDKQIPMKAIEKMYRKLEVPTIAECHELIVIK